MYLLTNDKESQARHYAAARRRGAGVSRQRPRRAVLPDAAGDQVHSHRRQDRTEPGARSGSDLRADQAAGVPRRHLAANQRRRASSNGSTTARRRSRSIPRWSAGTTTRSIRSGFATTRPSRSKSKSAARFPGHVVFRSQLEPVLHDYQTVQFSSSVPAGQKKDLLFEIVSHQGRNAKQNNVTLEAAAIKP